MPTFLTGASSAYERRIVSDSNDVAQGRTIVVEQLKPGGIQGGSITGPPPDPGAPCGLVSIEALNAGNGMSKYVWTFRASPDQEKSGSSDLTKRPQPISEINGTLQAQPITMHKNFPEIYEKFGKTMRGGQVEWLDKNPDASSSALSKQDSGSVNPMAGISTFSKGGAVFSEAKFYSSRSNVPDIVQNVGRINNPPGVDGENDEWILIGASVSPMGSGYRVDKKWLRDDRGWLKELYPRQ
jgi:hypothetical protein